MPTACIPPPPLHAPSGTLRGDLSCLQHATYLVASGHTTLAATAAFLSLNLKHIYILTTSNPGPAPTDLLPGIREEWMLAAAALTQGAQQAPAPPAKFRHLSMQDITAGRLAAVAATKQPAAAQGKASPQQTGAAAPIFNTQAWLSVRPDVVVHRYHAYNYTTRWERRVLPL